MGVWGRGKFPGHYTGCSRIDCIFWLTYYINIICSSMQTMYVCTLHIVHDFMLMALYNTYCDTYKTNKVHMMFYRKVARFRILCCVEMFVLIIFSNLRSRKKRPEKKLNFIISVSFQAARFIQIRPDFDKKDQFIVS